MQRLSLTIILLMLFTSTFAQTQKVIKVAVVPVEFYDVKFPSSDNVVLRLDSVFNQQNYSAYGADGSVSDYFGDNLGDSYDLSFHVCDPVSLPYSMSYYASSGDPGDSGSTFLIEHTVSSALASGINFSGYDGDSNGYIDVIYIIYAGYGAFEGNSSDQIDPHTWDVSSKKIKAGDLKVGTYCCSPYYYGETGDTLTPIGIICHEMGHALGLYDMYDVNGDVEGTAEALWGTLSLMDKGNYNNGGRTPPYLNAVEREILGIADVETITLPGSYYLTPIDIAGKAFRISTSDPDEYFLIEYRDGSGWDRYIGGSGLLVYHVDKSPNQAGSMTAVERWMVNAVNCCAEHQCVDLIEAYGGDGAKVGDVFFPGRKEVSGLYSVSDSPLLSWDEKGPMLSLNGIGVVGGTAFFTLEEDHLWLEPAINGYSIIPNQTDAVFSWSCDSLVPGVWSVAWKSDSDDTWQSSEDLSEMDYIMRNLEAGTSYNCRLSYSYLGVYFEMLDFSFSTKQITSKYPVIAGLEGTHYVGDTLCLRVFNLNEKVKSISWMINGASYYQESYPLTYKGVVSIAVNLKYPDGSTEKISRSIIVSEGDYMGE